MASLSKSALIRFLLDGVEVNAPLEWPDIEVLASFEDENVQANITTDSLTFVLEARDLIRNRIQGGLGGGVGIFEGMPFEIQTYNNNGVYVAFKGLLDLTDGLQDDEDNGRIIVRLKKDDGLNSLDERLSAITFGSLEDKGLVGIEDYFDVEYNVIQKVQAEQIITTAIVSYLLFKEIANQIRSIGKDNGNTAGHAGGGATGPLAAAIFAAIIIILQLAYAGLLLALLIDLANDMIETFLPKKRKHKVAKFRRLLEVICQELGYNLVSPIEELEFLAYLPSNPNVDDVTALGFISDAKGTTKGIPNAQDYGYSGVEMFTLARNLFNAKIAIIGQDLHLRSENDPFWIKNSTYKMQSVILPAKEYNTDELFGNVLLAFDTDIVDEWTIDNFTGTNFQVRTDANIVNNENQKFIKGFDNIQFPVCLGNRKDELTPLENALLPLAKTFDDITGIFGGGTNFAAKIKSSLGILKVSNNNHSKPKLLYLNNNNKIPVNHRDLWSARVLWEKYHSYKSFVDNNFFGQKIRYNGVNVPFGLDDFEELIQNSYFEDIDGRYGKITKVTWNIGSDKAVLDYWSREIYTRNLIEQKIEP